MSNVDIDRLEVESHLTTLNGSAQALAMLSHSPDLDEPQRDAIAGMADAFEAEFKALWRLIFGGEYPRASDPPAPPAA